MKRPIVFYLVVLLSGIIFGLGLAVSQMINPAKVLNFLDLAGNWDPTLLVVFAGALAVSLPVYQWALRRRKAPLLAEKFHVPENNTITPSLLGGAALFGIGWGLVGLCPGPGITALGTLMPKAFAWVIAFFAGAACYRILAR